MKLFSAAALLVSASLPSIALAAVQERFSTSSVPIYHRFLSSTATTTPSWSKRGTLHLDVHTDEAWIEEDTDAFKTVDHTGERYQVAVPRIGEDEDDMSSVVVDSCMLLHSPNKPFRDTITLFFTPPPDHDFVHLKYSTNSDEGCGELSAGHALVLGPRSLPKMSDVAIDRGITLSLITYKEAVQIKIDEEGKVVKPPPEKSFLEKYWMYLIPMVLFLLLGGGEEDKGAAKA